MNDTFEKFKSVINSLEVGCMICRRELIKLGRHTTIDNYRNYSCQAGYLKWISSGEYLIVKHFPNGLTTGNLMKAGYPNSDWTKKYKLYQHQ
jgi:hypothetical protein